MRLLLIVSFYFHQSNLLLASWHTESTLTSLFQSLQPNTTEERDPLLSSECINGTHSTKWNVKLTMVKACGVRREVKPCISC